ncbi:tyrosine-type recombinase/integrase [Streptomyces uncialis]|uniref:tyrosine-type recombinase/integrase n=1 Tax=Streptomyces uncialis TaxID=1048205 RepID=UPI0038659BC5|nr:site-specific integrase [Streptomyces uncialis]
MASIRKRAKKDGSATYQVRWLQGGRGGDWEDEKFGDVTAAEDFKRLVDAHGQQWPYGWIKGRGFVEPEVHPDDVPFLGWAHRYVDRLTGVEPRTKKDYARDIDNHLTPLTHTGRDGVQRQYGGLVHTLRDGTVMPATVATLTEDDVADWVRVQTEGIRDPDDPKAWLLKKASPKSIANRHGLLFCVFQAAVDAPQPVRLTNPCTKTKLPRTDDQTEEEMCFLEHDEYARISREMRAFDPAAADLIDFLAGTGLRWGEATALQVRDINTRRKTVNVQRAWRRQEDNTHRVGPPKSRKSRRTLALSEMQMELLRHHLRGRQQPEDFIFRGRDGAAWRHSNFYNRKWKRAVNEAVSKGLPKRPRLHDLRHTHVSWLIAANIPLPAIQARLGHESITTTVDRYGHLVRALDAEITAAVETAMTVPMPPRLRAVTS